MSARHSGKDAPSGCLGGTRIDILHQAEDWAKKLLPDEYVYWVTGLAGTGKSALMRSLCDQLARLGILGASFFISRNNKERMDPENVVRTIAHQLARFYPPLLSRIAGSIHANPDIVHNSLVDQIHHLLEVPLSSIAESLEQPIVIVIDGLDECAKDENGREGGDLLPALLTALEKCMGKVTLIISSRLEQSIQKMFTGVRSTSFELHNVDKSIVQADIRLDFETWLQKIPYRPPNWPSEEALKELTERAGNLFVYASTVVNFVSVDGVDPVTRLRNILDKARAQGRSAYHELDQIYGHVLRTIIPPGLEPDETEELVQRVRTLLGILVVLRMPMSVSGLVELLRMEERFLRRDLNSISAIVVTQNDGRDDVVQLSHASFPDYLADPSRCSEFAGTLAIRPQESHGYIVHRGVSYIEGATGSATESALSTFYDKSSWEFHFQHASSETCTEAIGLLRGHVQQLASNHPLYVSHMNYLLTALWIVHEHDSDPAKLEEWISLGRRSLELCDGDDAEKSELLNNLAGGLLHLYRHSRDELALSEAVNLNRQALSLRPTGHLSRHDSLNNLANALAIHYERSKNTAILAEAITLHRESLGLRPTGHPSRHYSLNNLAGALISQYDQSRDVTLLTEVIALRHEALRLRPPGHPKRRILLYNLGSCYWLKYEHGKDWSVLDMAIQFMREALALWSSQDLSRYGNLGYLSTMLVARYSLTTDAAHLHEAVALARECLSLCPGGWRREYALSKLIGALERLVEHGQGSKLEEELQRLRDEHSSLKEPSS
jgi:hypothetical protein